MSGTRAGSTQARPACVDFKQSQKVLGLDFYVQPSPSGELRVSEIIIHRIDGKEVPKK